MTTEHPMRGPKWDAAEDAHRKAWAALQDYKQALRAAGVRADSSIGVHVSEAENHLKFGRP